MNAVRLEKGSLNVESSALKKLIVIKKRGVGLDASNKRNKVRERQKETESVFEMGKHFFLFTVTLLTLCLL